MGVCGDFYSKVFNLSIEDEEKVILIFSHQRQSKDKKSSQTSHITHDPVDRIDSVSDCYTLYLHYYTTKSTSTTLGNYSDKLLKEYAI